MFDNFGAYLDRLLNVVTPQTGKLFSTKNALIWFMLFERFSKKGLKDNLFQMFLENYEEFKRIKVKIDHEYELIKGSGKYTNNLSFAELDGCKSTKDKGIIDDKLHILEVVMNDFIHNNCTSEECDIENQAVTAKDIIKEYVNGNVDDDEIELYEMMTNDFSEAIEDINSDFLSDVNRPSFVALVGYADQLGKSELLSGWLPKFEKDQDIIINQKENFLHMKNDFEEFCKDGEINNE